MERLFIKIISLSLYLHHNNIFIINNYNNNRKCYRLYFNCSCMVIQVFIAIITFIFVIIIGNIFLYNFAIIFSYIVIYYTK